ncbi:YabP/YqfC family sporulation protein [Anaerosporobacter faecicola]|uniref:YabP/YqfC family sporulation protein n=1 Tax=Anaerosporobacter faecicola TaxID=2718714 RepID=UPI00143B44D5|nr:YabP/YqfC family sporulation protein [Anaerosporobacter faecicola]
MSKNIKSSHNTFKKKSKKTLYKQFDRSQKKVSPEEKESYLETLSKNLSLPGDMIAGAPIITTTGRCSLCIENYKGIIEYNSNVIKVQTKTGKICVEGNNLIIKYFTNDEMRVTGIVHSIKYC